MRDIRHLVLVGPRGAGKSTLAAALGRALGWPAIDGDELLAGEVGATAGEYLARAGEAAFREVEERVSGAVLDGPGPSVVALGGGAVLSERVRRALRAADVFTVFLIAAPEVLARRLRADPTPRPPLTDLPPDREMEEVSRWRLPLYREVADLEIDTGTCRAQECVAKALEAARGR